MIKNLGFVDFLSVFFAIVIMIVVVSLVLGTISYGVRRTKGSTYIKYGASIIGVLFMYYQFFNIPCRYCTSDDRTLMETFGLA